MAQVQQEISELEYLARERQAESRSEFFASEIFGMAGASRNHNLITANIVAELRNALREKPYEVYPSDMRVKVSKTGLYTYPDAVVACGEPEFEDRELDTLLNPKILVEVLSKSMAAYDLGKKFEHYRALDSVEELVFAASETLHVLHYRRRAGDGSSWILSETRDRSFQIKLASIGVTLEIAEIYSKVDLNLQPAPISLH